MIILFHMEQIGERGTEVSTFDYALGNRNILGGISYMTAPSTRVFDTSVLERMRKEFEVYLYSSIDDLASFIKEKNIDLLYAQVSGNKEALSEIPIPQFVHCVFTTKDFWGTYYSSLSPYLNKYFRTVYPVLPYIVKKFPGNTSTLYEELGIPKGSLVFGSYGGADSFSIQFVKDVIRQVALRRKDIYFIFLNFKPFVNSEEYKNIFFLPRNTDIAYKEIFINTCDAMIHARADGETFGLAVAEFSVKNKPVITWAPRITKNFIYCLKSFVKYLVGKYYIYAEAHLDFLGEKAITYATKKDLFDIFLHFKTKCLKPINYDCYSERFSEEKVMHIFNDIIKK